MGRRRFRIGRERQRRASGLGHRLYFALPTACPCPSRCLSLTFHCLSLTFPLPVLALPTAFPRPSTTFPGLSLPFPLPVLALRTAFSCRSTAFSRPFTAFPRPPTAFHRPSATFSCPSLPSHCLSLTLNCRCALPFPRPVIVSVPFLRRLAAFPSASHRTIPAAGHGHRLPGRRHQPPGLRRRVRPTPVCGTKEMSSALFDAPTCHLFGCSLTKHLLCILPERHQRDCISPV